MAVTVIKLVWNSGLSLWEPAGSASTAVTLSIPPSGTSTNPYRYISKESTVQPDPDPTTFDWQPLSSVTGSGIFTVSTEEIHANLSDDTDSAAYDHTIIATKFTLTNSAAVSGTAVTYRLFAANGIAYDDLTITAIQRDLTQIEVAYDTDPNGSHHWVTRTWNSIPELPDDSYNFPALTPLWDLPIAYVRHIKILDTTDYPTGSGTLESYENITDWYNGPISTSNAWITTSTSTKALFNQDGSPVVGTNATLLFVNITSGQTASDSTSHALHVNPTAAGLADKTRTVTITARTPVTITQDYLRPADNNSEYKFSPILVGGAAAGSWLATGLPTGYSITAAGEIKDEISSRATRTLPAGINHSTVTLTYNTNTVQNYLPNTTSKVFTFRQYSLEYITNPTSTNLITGVVNQPYADNNGIYHRGDANASDIFTYYNANKPTNWDGAHTLSQGTFSSTSSVGTGIVVSAPLITASGNLSTLVDIIITNDANGDLLPLPSQDTSPFHVRRTFTIPIGTAPKTFKVGPADPMSITTRAEQSGGKTPTLIGFQVIEENGFTDPNSRYIVTNPAYLGSTANGLFEDNVPASGGYAKFDYIWLPIKANAAEAVHYVQFTRELTSIIVAVTINNNVDTSTTAQISNVTYSGYVDPSSGTVHDITYPFYQASIGNPSYPGDVLQTFSVTVKSSAPHIVPPVGFFQLTAASGSADDLFAISSLIDVYDGNGVNNGYHLIQGNTCTVKFRTGVTATSPSLAANFNGTAYLDFHSYADGSLTGTRRVVISIKKSRASLTVTPSTIQTQPVVGVASSQQFTVGGAPVGQVTYSLSGTGLSYFTNYAISSTGLFTGMPNAATAAYTFNIDVHDSDTPNKSGFATVTGSISAAPSGPAISLPVIPNTWDVGSDQTITINGSNFGATNTVQIYQPGVLNSNTFLTITAQSVSQITATYTAGTHFFTGNGNIGVTRLSDGKLATAPITLTSTATARINSVDTPTTTAAGSSVQLTIRGTGFTSSGFIGYKAYGTGSWIEYPITAAGDGTSATSTGTIPLGQQGTATVYYIQSSHVAGLGSVSLVVTASAITTVTLTDTDSSTPYVGSSTVGSPTNVSITRSLLRTFQLSTNVAGATYSLGATTLPLGFTLNGTTGEITGTATESSVTTAFAITATSGANNKTVYYSFNIIGGILTLGAQNFTVHVGETGVSKQIVYTGGTGTVSFTMQGGSGSLPNDLILNTNGTITGSVSATTLQDYTFIAVATDQAAVSKTATITVTLAAAYTSPLITNITPAVGAIGGGTQVTLTVSDVHPSFVVTVGGSVASIVSQALSNFNGTIVISTPAHALGAVNVTVTNTDGRVSPAVIFTYSNIIAPEFTALSPLPYGPFAGNQQLVLTGQNFVDGMTVTFGANNYGTGWATSNVEILSPTLAHVKTPAYAGAGVQTTKQIVDLVLANGGETKVVTGGYNYMPPPTIAAVIPPTGPSAGGTTIYITGANFFETNGLKPRVFIGAVEIPADRITLK